VGQFTLYRKVWAFLQFSEWKECSWVETTTEATKLPRELAERLMHELEQRESGPIYTVECDEKGESNQPPYGLDNFVVRRADL
jgi:hypothetical protein